MVSRAPDAVTICCSFVPANCPSIACVTDVGGWIVSEYINILEVAAILLVRQHKAGTQYALFRLKSSPKARDSFSGPWRPLS